jgi:hypothetical protein
VSGPRQHHCHADGCEVRVRPELLMCRKHWFMVPARIRRLVLLSYRPGQCDAGRPSQMWIDAAKDAIRAVAAAEGKP